MDPSFGLLWLQFRIIKLLNNTAVARRNHHHSQIFQCDRHGWRVRDADGDSKFGRWKCIYWLCDLL
jgi:hypothetical protein